MSAEKQVEEVTGNDATTSPGEDRSVISSKKADMNDITGDIDPANEAKGFKLILIHVAICLCTFLVGLDFNLIATAVPVITAQFNSTRDIGWYSAAFMISMCAVTPLAGKTYTLFPQKLVYLCYVVVFEAGSLICALAPSSATLIAGRVIAGAGAAGIFAGGFAILSIIVPLQRRAVWIGSMGATFSIASIVGPLISGGLTQHVTWRWCFYMNLPIGGAAAILFALLVHVKRTNTKTRTFIEALLSLDIPGAILFAGAITMLLLPLQLGGVRFKWSSSLVIGMFVGFAVTLPVFVAWVIFRQEQALIPPRLFTVNRNPLLLCAAAFFINGPFQAIIFWLPIWFQGVLRSTPTQSGVNFLPTVISDVLAAFIGAGLATKLGWWNPFLLFAEAMVCLGAGLLTTIYPDISAGHWIGYQIFGGIGYSLASNLSHVAIQASLPHDLAPLGSSTLLSIISASCAIFMAINQAVFQTRLQSNLGSLLPEDTVHKIINAGVTDLSSIVSSAEFPEAVMQYSRSVTEVFYIPAVAPALSFVLLLGCEWISTKSNEASATKAATTEGHEKENSEEGATV